MPKTTGKLIIEEDGSFELPDGPWALIIPDATGVVLHFDPDYEEESLQLVKTAAKGLPVRRGVLKHVH